MNQSRASRKKGSELREAARRLVFSPTSCTDIWNYGMSATRPFWSVPTASGFSIPDVLPDEFQRLLESVFES